VYFCEKAKWAEWDLEATTAPAHLKKKKDESRYYLIGIREYAYRQRAADTLALGSGDVVARNRLRHRFELRTS